MGDFLNMLTEHFAMTVILLVFLITIVSIVMGIALEFYKATIKGHQKSIELRNEQLRLQLQMKQQEQVQGPASARGKRDRENWGSTPESDTPRPKDASWMEQAQVSYDMGYQRRD